MKRVDNRYLITIAQLKDVIPFQVSIDDNQLQRYIGKVQNDYILDVIGKIIFDNLCDIAEGDESYDEIWEKLYERVVPVIASYTALTAYEFLHMKITPSGVVVSNSNQSTPVDYKGLEKIGIKIADNADNNMKILKTFINNNRDVFVTAPCLSSPAKSGVESGGVFFYKKQGKGIRLRR
jgi:hypothetical protein